MRSCSRGDPPARRVLRLPFAVVRSIALAARAAQLRKVELIRPKSVIGKNTVEALQSGTIFGFAGQVDGLVDRITAELAESYDQAPTVIATGGLAPLIIGVAETIDEHEPDLTLIGLRLIHERNI